MKEFEVGHRYRVKFKTGYVSVFVNASVFVKEWICTEIRDTHTRFIDVKTGNGFDVQNNHLHHFQIIDDLGLEPGYKPLEL